MKDSLDGDLKRIFSRVLHLDGREVDDELTRDNVESWDSFNHLVLISEIERKLRICFSLSDVERIKSFKMLREIAVKNQS